MAEGLGDAQVDFAHYSSALLAGGKNASASQLTRAGQCFRCRALGHCCHGSAGQSEALVMLAARRPLP